MAVEACRAAADPSRFPEQIAEGLRPWQAAKVYIGGVRENEDWTVRINSGRFTPSQGPNLGYYKQAGGKETTLFHGLPTTMAATVGAAGRAIGESVAKAISAFSLTDPSAAAPALAEGLKLVRAAMIGASPDATHVLRIKERQFQVAINAALGAELRAVTNPPLMAAPVAGQTFNVDVQFAARGQASISPAEPTLVGDAGWSVQPAGAGAFRVTLVGDGAISTKPYFARTGLQESRYTLSDPAQFGRPLAPAPLTAVARYQINGVPVEIRETVKRREAKLPYGDVTREVRSVPRIAVMLTPAQAIVPTSATTRRVEVEVSLLHNAEMPTTGAVTLRLPPGWTSAPTSQPLCVCARG